MHPRPCGEGDHLRIERIIAKAADGAHWGLDRSMRFIRRFRAPLNVGAWWLGSAFIVWLVVHDPRPVTQTQIVVINASSHPIHVVNLRFGEDATGEFRGILVPDGPGVESIYYQAMYFRWIRGLLVPVDIWYRRTDTGEDLHEFFTADLSPRARCRITVVLTDQDSHISHCHKHEFEDFDSP
jgi:hypothetical protein